MSLDGIRRPHDDLLPSFVGGGRIGYRDRTGPPQSTPTAAWPSTYRDSGAEAALSTNLQEFLPFRDEIVRAPDDHQGVRGVTYDEYEEDSGGRCS